MAGPGSFAADCHICRITLCGLIPQSVIFHKGRLRPEDDDDRMKHPVLEMIESAMEPFGRMPVLAAVSGGADSVCLLMALRELGYEVSAVHVEHGIRGEESLEDCAFVRGLCAENRIPLSVVSVDAPSSARSLSMTLEEAARLERRRVYRETAQRLGIEVVATAHHRMDQAETVLWNLIRGTSTGGLGGIRPVRRESGLIMVRPLLSCGRDQIEEYLLERGIIWRTDRTNADTQITRNAIRLEIMPLLKRLNAGAAEHIAQAAKDLQQVEDFLIQEEDALWKRVILENGDGHGQDLTADRRALSASSGLMRTRILRRMIIRCIGSAKDISRTHVRSLEDLVQGPNGKTVCLPDGLTASSEEGLLRMTRRKARTVERVIALDKDGSYVFPGVKEAESGRILVHVAHLAWNGGSVPKKKYTKYLAYDTMAPCLVLRTRRPGDYLMVNSSLGRRKLKDYLIDEKIPRHLRDTIPVIAQGSHVLWVVGMRISEGAKVKEGMNCVRISVSDYSQQDCPDRGCGNGDDGQILTQRRSDERNSQNSDS